MISRGHFQPQQFCHSGKIGNKGVEVGRAGRRHTLAQGSKEDQHFSMLSFCLEVVLLMFFFTCASGMCKPLGSRQLLKGSNSLEWTCYSMTWKKCYWPFLRENHHRNEFASSTYKDQKDSWCSLPGPFSAVLHRGVFIFTVYKRVLLGFEDTERWDICLSGLTE